MTGVMPAIGTQPSDAELVAASRNGDREAFGQIVRRYQGMISGLIYAACGDIHRSEDVAQETFLSAWKSLSGLRESSKLPAWLCQIARHRTQDVFRKSSSEKVGIGGFWARLRERSAAPDEELVRKEEESVLWRALSELPQPYRETLVLYYRQGHSTEQVAAAMETSEESVRQRLSRGREMLRAEVASMIERNLESTAPSPAFALSVLAALPAVAQEAAKGAGVAGAAKGSLAANSSWLVSLTGWLGAIGGLAGGMAGSWAALRDDRTAAERKLTIAFLIKLWLLVLLLVPGCVALFALRGRTGWSDPTFATLVAGLFSIYWALVATIVVRYQSNSGRVRDPGRPFKMGVGPSILISAGPTFGALTWLLNLALEARDQLAAGIAGVAMVAITVCGIYVIRRSVRMLMLTLTIAFCGVIVATLNWRLDAWLVTMRATGPATTHVPLWSVNCFALALVVWVSFVTFDGLRSKATQPVN